MRGDTGVEFPEDRVAEEFFGQRSTFLSAGLGYKSASCRAAADAAFSEAGGSVATKLLGARGTTARIPRSEARAPLNAPVWLTSLHKPGVFEIASTENVSRVGIQSVTHRPWEADEMVLVSSPPGLCRQGWVVYCRKLPSDDYVLGIRLSAPVEDWIETLGLVTARRT
jgi:hypothetical protein